MALLNTEANKHMIDILRAALPHLNGSTKKPIELAVQASEFFDNLSSLQNTNELSACSFENEPIDVESLLVHIQDVCNESEKEMIHMILNFLNARKIYQAYDAFRSISNQGTNDATFSNPPNMMDFLTSQLSSEQKSTFDNLSMMMNAINT